MRIGIAGAGHAGVEAARTASEAGAETVLFSGESVLPYHRPRLPAFTFGQASADDITMHPLDWYVGKNVELRLDAPAQHLDPVGKSITAGGVSEVFDAIIIATGASPRVPRFAADVNGCVTPLWDFRQAQQIRANARPGAHLLVVGGGLIGLEAALRAASTGISVDIIEGEQRLLPRHFGVAAGKLIRQRLETRDIRLKLGTTVTGLEEGGNNKIAVKFGDSDRIVVDMVILAAGVKRDTAFASAAGLCTQGAIPVDSTLGTSVPGIFACGDAALLPGSQGGTATAARAQGRTAGLNACAHCTGAAPVEYVGSPASYSFKHEEFEVHSAGSTSDETNEEVLLEVEEPSSYRALVMKNGVTVGVQMVGTGRDFHRYVEAVKEGAR
jgi:NADPH-dependent 2,4-dienoyl-CoA reductase/sulfur reductase-like enzyme